ncbi:hypothetical protein D3C80_1326810 [compost metagenome]
MIAIQAQHMSRAWGIALGAQGVEISARQALHGIRRACRFAWQGQAQRRVRGDGA